MFLYSSTPSSSEISRSLRMKVLLWKCCVWQCYRPYNDCISISCIQLHYFSLNWQSYLAVRTTTWFPWSLAACQFYVSVWSPFWYTLFLCSNRLEKAEKVNPAFCIILVFFPPIGRTLFSYQFWKVFFSVQPQYSIDKSHIEGWKCGRVRIRNPKGS